MYLLNHLLPKAGLILCRDPALAPPFTFQTHFHLLFSRCRPLPPPALRLPESASYVGKRLLRDVLRVQRVEQIGCISARLNTRSL